MISSTGHCLMPVTGLFHADGGIAAVNRLGLYALNEQGYRVDVLALIEKDNSVDTRYLSHGSVTYQVFSGRKVHFAQAVWKALLHNRYDLVLVDHVNVASILALPSLVGRLRYAVWLCGIEVFPPRPDWEGKLGLRSAWRRLAISDYTRASVAARFPDLSIDVCDLALDPVKHQILSGMTPRAALTEPIVMHAIDGSCQVLGDRTILHVGRMAQMERQKGQDVLLQAMPIVLDYYPDAQLVLVGRGDDQARLLYMARALPAAAQARVFMPGYVADELLDRLYRTCFLFAMPSKGEGFGLVYLEAMSRGKPCLGGRVDATPYIVRDGVTGVLVKDPRSPEEVSTALRSLLSDPGRALAMGQAGYELVQSYYLFDHFRDRFWKALLG